ncbi:MAG: arginine--tRNA ligase [Gemmatimonadota bacterium]
MTGRASPGTAKLVAELGRAVGRVGGPADFEPRLERPRDPTHGDWSSNAALVLAGRLGVDARELAERIRTAFDAEAAGVTGVEVAGPGFLNFSLSDAAVWDCLPRILGNPSGYGRTEAEAVRRINVEFVSSNPTGPLHVAHGRGAALGDVIASLLEWTGHEVTREFYVNDAGRQVDLLGASVEARFQELQGNPAEIPPDGYHGEYLRELARGVAEEEGADRLLGLSSAERARLFARRCGELLLAEQRRDLEELGIHMQVWRRESELVAEGRMENLLERLRTAGLTYEEGGAVWLRTTRFGDEKDRVLVKRDGSYTYFTPDIAYHVEKWDRGFEHAIDVWGADHHGHVARMQAALEALGLPAGFLEVVILQLVTVLRGGEEVRMSKRAGEFVTLRELFEETGTDVARYFFLMRRAEVALNFDLDLALDVSERNPVYKVQYAHARMCSVFRRGGIDPSAIPADGQGTEELKEEAERRVARALARFPEVVRSAAAARAPHQLCGYLEETAGRVNAWYHRGNLDPSLRVLAEGPAREGRLRLARAVQITLRNGLRVLGISAPERMEREEKA